MADSAASPKSRPRRSASTKPRTATVSTETENKLARAARSAQRLAQLSDVPRDESTLDLFPDDPTRATLEAMTIDLRQGTLTGFELPAEVRAAVGFADDVEPITAGQDAKSARRVTRAAKVDETASASVQASVLDERAEPTLGLAGARDDVTVAAKQGDDAAVKTREGVAAAASTAAMAEPDVAGAVSASASDASVASAATSGSRAASVLPAAPSMSSSALRSIAAARASEAAASAQPGGAPQRFATTFARAATASRENSTESSDTAASGDAAASASQAAGRASMPGSTQQNTAGSPAARPYVAQPASAATNAAPELDRARATAFADTVDALYGVIADQRRAGSDHSRRMKWMLSIVVGALLVTVAIGITQTMLLMRLTHETTTQQQRIEQMMLNEQATLSTLLDTDSATVSVPAVTPPAPPAAAAPRQTPAAQATQATKRATNAAHAHKTKPAASH
jgi:hypothetical protein